MKISLFAVVIGFLVDLVLGDPHKLWHPVQGIGWLISKIEKMLRQRIADSETGARFGGVLLVILVLVITGGTAVGILIFADRIHPGLRFTAESIMCWQILAMKSLKTESMKVYEQLKQNSLSGARQAVSYIVGRDTAQLTAEEVTKAAVETVAENTADGVTAPLFYLIIGGPVLGFLYKAVNTMDSMVGYKNDKYIYFGRAAARLDDICNYVPSRLTALVMLMGAWVMPGYHGREAGMVYRQDRRKHASPNAAQTEAVMAGALGVQLAGDACYFGKVYQKETIGVSLRAIEAEDIVRANRLLYFTGSAFAVIGIIVRTLLI